MFNKITSLILYDNDESDDIKSRKISIPTIRLIKIGLSPSKIVGFICFNKNPLQIMKNSFYNILEMFKLLSWLLRSCKATAW